MWPDTDSSVTAVVACPYGPNGVTASRACTSNGYWESANVTRCATTISNEFRNISTVNINYFVFYLCCFHSGSIDYGEQHSCVDEFERTCNEFN